MTIDEQELHRRLEDTAAQASPPRFTAVDLTRKIRRRRSLVTGTVGAVAVAATAIAVVVPVTLNGAGQPAISRPAIQAPLPGPRMSVTVNGQTQAAPTAHYVIVPGEKLTIILDVTVPAHKSLSALWAGITNDLLAPTLDGPADMSPILAAYRTPLGPGVHQFRLHWVIPAQMRAGTSRQLSVEWLWSNPPIPGGGGEGIVAELNVPSAYPWPQKIVRPSASGTPDLRKK